MAFPVEVMSVGTWNQTKFTLNHLKEIAENFKKLKEVIKPPVKLGHTNSVGAPALGWVSNMEVKGNKLIAFLEDVPELLMKVIRKKFYKRVSSEIMFGFKYKGKNFGRVFSGLALLGAETPAVKDLEDLTAYLTQTSEGEFEKMVFYEFQNDNVINRQGDNKMTKEDFTIKFEELNKKILSLEKDLVNKDAEITSLEQKVKAADEKERKFVEDKARDEVMAFCENFVKDGVITPAQRDLINSDSIILLEDNQPVVSFTTFKSFVEAGKKKRDDGHKTEDNDQKKEKTFADPQEEVTRLAQKYAEENKVDFSKAIQAVLSDPENKDLANKYTEDFSDKEN